MSKQREEFEAWYEEKIGKSICFKTYDNSYLRRDTDEAWQAWQQAQKVAVPNPTNEMICAIEREVENQLVASGINQDPFRLDGEKIFNAMIEEGEKK